MLLKLLELLRLLHLLVLLEFLELLVLLESTGVGKSSLKVVKDDSLRLLVEGF